MLSLRIFSFHINTDKLPLKLLLYRIDIFCLGSYKILLVLLYNCTINMILYNIMDEPRVEDNSGCLLD